MLAGVNISNCHRSGVVNSIPMIKWGRILTSCISINNYSTCTPIHDTTQALRGSIISENDLSDVYPDIETNTQFIAHVKNSISAFDLDDNSTLTNIVNNSSFEANIKWNDSNVTHQLLNNTPFRGSGYYKITGHATINNSSLTQTLNKPFSVGDKYLLYLVSRSDNLAPFKILLNDLSGSTLGFLDFTPSKINTWEIYTGIFDITLASTSNYIALYPKTSTNSANMIRDFDSIALYKVSKQYSTLDSIKNIGYTHYKVGIANKLDPNGDGVADTPYGTTVERPYTTDIGYTRFNTTYNKLETWNGTVWVDGAGVTLV